MLTRPQYHARKKARIEELQLEAEIKERELESIYLTIATLEEETFEEMLGDAKYDSWKAKREEL